MDDKTNHNDTIEDTTEIPAPKAPWLTYVSVVLAVLAIFGFVTWMLGLGPFAYRQIWYGTSEIYILNMTDQEVQVTLDRGTPRTIKSESADRTPILGGSTHIVTRDKQGKIIEEMDIFVDGNPVFYNVEGFRCLALADATSYYGAASKGIEILATYPKGTRIITLPHNNMIWPRQTLRDRVAGGAGVAWIEIIACTMVGETESNILQAHLDYILTDRKRQQQDIAKQKEINRLMMQGDSHAVDGIVQKTPDAASPPDEETDTGKHPVQ